MRILIPFSELTDEQQLFMCQVFNSTREDLKEHEFAFINGQFDAPYHFYGER